MTAAIVAVSFLLTPSAWFDWYTFLTSSTERGEALFLRVGVGIVLMVLAALSGRRWLVPVAIWIALPVVWIESWVILLAIIRLGRMPAEAPAAPEAPVSPPLDGRPGLIDRVSRRHRMALRWSIPAPIPVGHSYRSAPSKAGARLHRPCASPYSCTGSPSPSGWC